jgi:general secretion pathway protein H
MSSAGSIRHSAAGFTLLEMMVVLTILALALTVVPVHLMNATGGQALKSDVRMLISALNYARTKAISSNMPVALVLDRENMRLTINGSQQIGLLSKTTTFGIVNQGTFQAGTPTIVQFYPEGGSSGGELLLSYERDEYRVSVNWLTGAVSTIRR